MKDYNDFRLEDFVTDESFCNWVIHPDVITTHFWEDWQSKNTDKVELLEEAHQYVVALHQASSGHVATDLSRATWSAINTTIDKTNHNGIYLKHASTWLVAASILFFGGLLFHFIDTDVTGGHDSLPVVEWVEYFNDQESVERIELADGSVITLEPQSSARYPSFFEGNKRSVILNGEAFFEIARDTSKPFYVYAKDAVIRVLGTSFYVKAKESDKEVEVIVRTGKVAVYQRKDVIRAQRLKTRKITPLYVTPNQKVVLNEVTQKFTKRLIATPSLVKPLSTLKQLRFVEAPISDIFEALEKVYEVSIRFDEETLGECPLTTTLTQQTLFETLDMIFTSVGLSYEEVEGDIVIKGICK